MVTQTECDRRRASEYINGLALNTKLGGGGGGTQKEKKYIKYTFL